MMSWYKTRCTRSVCLSVSLCAWMRVHICEKVCVRVRARVWVHVRACARSHVRVNVDANGHVWIVCNVCTGAVSIQSMPRVYVWVVDISFNLSLCAHTRVLECTSLHLSCVHDTRICLYWHVISILCRRKANTGSDTGTIMQIGSFSPGPCLRMTHVWTLQPK